MINWTEEDVKFIINNILNPMFEGYAEAHNEANNISHETYMKTFDMMASRIRDIDYERHRDKDFFLAYLGQSKMYSSKEILERAYDSYCKEYDRLNKHLICENHKWFSPNEKMPNIGDKIVVRDWSGEEMEIVFDSFPTDVNQSNVMMWRYIE